jgi:ArsR family transcriptional regulator
MQRRRKENKMEEKSQEKEYIHAHEDVIENVQKKLPADEKLYELADFFRVFGDSTRIKILYVLLQSEMCVYDIASLLGMTQSAISHQLRVLKQMQLVKFRREGKTVFYSLSDSHIENILNQGMEHISEEN